jgi:hypothetical protein
MNGSNIASTDRTTWWQAALLIRGQTEADQRNIQAIWVWSLIAGAGFAATVLALKFFPQLDGPLAWLLATAPSILGIGLVRATLRFLRDADEFVRKVQLEGIAWGFGAGAVFCLGYSVLEQVGAPELPIGVALVPLTFGWAIGSFVVAYRHR